MVQVWNEACTSRGSFPLRGPLSLERFVFSKPYFDPQGLIIAEEDGKVIGFGHAGFGADPAEKFLVSDTGVICAVVVRPSHQRRGIGSELLARCEQYLAGLGAKDYQAGPYYPRNPFYFGMYGGSDNAGFLISDLAADPFFKACGYKATAACRVVERALSTPLPRDPRFQNLRTRYDTQLVPQPGLSSWWQECAIGQIEPVEFRLVDKLTGLRAAHLLAWEMDGFRVGVTQGVAGLLSLHVRSDMRRQGLARYLLAQVIAYLMQQSFTLIETHVPETNEPAHQLLKGMGFQEIDRGQTFHRNR
jgi:GNAT superfamily N-acetyltransferase